MIHSVHPFAFHKKPQNKQKWHVLIKIWWQVILTFKDSKIVQNQSSHFLKMYAGLLFFSHEIEKKILLINSELTSNYYA